MRCPTPSAPSRRAWGASSGRARGWPRASGTILDAGAADGSLRSDADAEDIVVALLGTALAAPADPERAGRLMDVLVRGVVAA